MFCWHKCMKLLKWWEVREMNGTASVWKSCISQHCSERQRVMLINQVKVVLTGRSDRCQVWENCPGRPLCPLQTSDSSLHAVQFISDCVCLVANRLSVMLVWKLPLFSPRGHAKSISPWGRMQPYDLYLLQRQTDFLFFFFFKRLTHCALCCQVRSQWAAFLWHVGDILSLESCTVINQLMAYFCCGFKAYFNWHKFPQLVGAICWY